MPMSVPLTLVSIKPYVSASPAHPMATSVSVPTATLDHTARTSESVKVHLHLLLCVCKCVLVLFSIYRIEMRKCWIHIADINRNLRHLHLGANVQIKRST